MTLAGKSQFLVDVATTPAPMVTVLLFVLGFRASSRQDYYDVYPGADMKWENDDWRY